MKLTSFASIAVLATVAAVAAPSPEWRAEGDFSKAPVYVSANATTAEIEAGRLVMRAQAMIAGEADPTTNVAPAVASEMPKAGVVIGWLESDLTKKIASKYGLKPWKKAKNGTDVIAQVQKGNVLYLVGNAPESAFFAAADLLYRNGARFIHTGEPEDGFTSGTYLDFMRELQAPKERVYVPVAAIRTGFALNDMLNQNTRCTPELFNARNFFAAANCTSPNSKTVYAGGHSRGFFGSECIQPAYHDFDKHRDFFPMNKEGQRFRPTGGWCWVMEGCWSTPGFLDWVIDRVAKDCEKAGPDNAFGFDVTNSDGGPKCLCPDCEKLRASYPDVASYYYDYNQKIQKALKKRFPDMKVETLAYIMSLRYPKLGNKLLTEVDAIDFCPYSRCYIHSYHADACPTIKANMQLMDEWKQADIPIGDFDYSFDVFQPSMHIPSWGLMADLVQYWKEYNGGHGVPRMYIESATSPNGNGGKSRIAAYVAARCLWDDSRTADDHLQDFCRAGFGPAADVMLEYERASAKAWRDQKAHLVNTFNNPLGTAKSYFTAELESHGKKAFAEAERLLKDAETGAKDERARTLVKKQLATLAWEKKCFDEWSALRMQAMRTSLKVNLEEGEDRNETFDRVPKFGMKTNAKMKEGGDVTKSTVQFYRTKNALRIRVTNNSEAFEPAEWKDTRNDSPAGYGANSMEFFLQAPGKSDYFHLAMAKAGEIYDAKCLDSTWTSGEYKVESEESKGKWVLTLTFPYSLFGIDSVKAGDSFKCIVINNAARKDEDGTVKGFHVGLPYPAYHDLAAGVDLSVDDNSGRRAGGD